MATEKEIKKAWDSYPYEKQLEAIKACLTDDGFRVVPRKELKARRSSAYKYFDYQK